ncbi:MAG TPA: hypothetical protein VFV38_46530 [Ktedonobacteraceae bacterium]|nr:hypothetical protein [Ktedonobacteraceae bacterium]
MDLNRYWFAVPQADCVGRLELAALADLFALAPAFSLPTASQTGHQETEIRAQLLALTSPLWKRGKELAVA